MLRTGKLDLSPPNRVQRSSPEGKPGWLHKVMLISPDKGESLTPNAFLVEQMPNTTVRPHFHENSQFQIFVGGSGTIGKSEIQPYTAQYVAGHTGYGPITAREYGLLYMTLRPSAPAGAIYLPEERHRLDRTRRMRQTMSEPCPAGTANAANPVVTLIEPEADGLAGWMVWVAPNQTVPAPVHPGGKARYYVVARGELIAADGAQLPPLSCAFTTADEMAMPLTAGPNGVEVMVLQFPADAD